ncbi:MAG: ABC transporter permease [Desulfovibrio sp.]|jgi:peptide/nickel transport system permease protein|nr:ABC transporter permease [Desulfovibrio sp.]
MFRFICKRLLFALPNLLGVLVFTFILARALPGDPAAFLAGPSADPAAIEEIRRGLGLDKSLIEQFIFYIRDMAHGDWGTSWTTGQPVTYEILTRLPASLELTFLGLFMAVAAAVPLGIASALRPGSPVDNLCRLLSTLGVSMPTFFSGLMLVYIFYYLLGLSPAPLGRLPAFAPNPADVTGFYLLDSLLATDFETFKAAFTQILLPALTLALFAMAPLARMTRASMLSVLSADFIRTARAVNLPRRKIIISYALRNALAPVLTTLGMVFSFTLGANVLVEKVFSWPGIGSFALEALIISDYAAVQGFVLVMGILYVLVNLAVDLLQILGDPRIRMGL